MSLKKEMPLLKNKGNLKKAMDKIPNGMKNVRYLNMVSVVTK